MAAKRPRKTIGDNPLDDLNEDGSAPATESGQTRAHNTAATAPSGTTKQVRRAAGPKRPSSARADTDARDTVSNASGEGEVPDADEQVNEAADEPQTAEALFAKECGSQQRFSPKRAVVVIKSKSDRHQRAMAIVKNWSQWSVAAGVVPVPLLDTVAISGVQLKMVHTLCKHYGVPFEKEAVIGIVGSLVGGAITTSLTDAVTHAFLKAIPYAEQVLQPTLSFATTYSLGFVFVQHFENNGTLRDFKVSSMRDAFRAQLAKSKVMFASRKRATA
jgi:uncharacterized protein (DUF697 family)